MPGIAGCVRLSGAETVPLPAGEVLLQPLSRDANYQIHEIVAGPKANAIVCAPSLRFPCAGAGVHPASGVKLGYYGEFLGRSFRGLSAAQTVLRLIELYDEHRHELPKQIEGSFVLLVWDPRTSEVLLCNDHLASRPVFYAEQNGCFYFSPEPKGIALLPGFQRSLDESAVITFLTTGHLLNNQTYYQQIRSLPPGHYVSIGSTVRMSAYYQYLPSEEPGDCNFASLTEGCAAALQAAVEKRMHHLPVTVVPLSGGYDSRGIVAELKALGAGTIKTVSWGVDEHTPNADAYIGRRVSEHFLTGHRFFKRDHDHFEQQVLDTVARTDGMTQDAAQHPGELELVRRLQRELNVDYLLRGDEVFGFKGAAASEKETLARIGVRELGDYPGLVRVIQPGRREHLQEQSRAVVEEVSRRCPLTQFTPRKDWMHFYQKIFNFASRSNYYKLSVIESVNPWLDKGVLDFLQTLPAACRVEKALYRHTLHSLFPDAMRIPIATRNSLENWVEIFRAETILQDFIRRHLLEPNGWLHEFVDPAPLRLALERIFAGKQTVSGSMRLLSGAKRLFRAALPGPYRAIKGRVIPHVSITTIDDEGLIARLLVLKLWSDRFV